MTPESLADWTLAAIRAVAASGMSENDRFEFKGELPEKASLRALAAAFANTRGGFVIFGVSNRGEVLGIANSELPRDVGNKLGAGLTPTVEFAFGPPLPVADGRIVQVCHVPPSSRGPHAVLVDERHCFLKRSPAGSNIPMTYEEIRFAFAGGAEVRTAVRLVEAEAKRMRDLASMMNSGQQHGYLGDYLRYQLRPAMMESAVARIFEILSKDESLVTALGELRIAAWAVDEEAIRVLTQAGNGRELANLARQVIHRADDVLRGLAPFGKR